MNASDWSPSTDGSSPTISTPASSAVSERARRHGHQRRIPVSLRDDVPGRARLEASDEVRGRGRRHAPGERLRPRYPHRPGRAPRSVPTTAPAYVPSSDTSCVGLPTVVPASSALEDVEEAGRCGSPGASTTSWWVTVSPAARESSGLSSGRTWGTAASGSSVSTTSCWPLAVVIVARVPSTVPSAGRLSQKRLNRPSVLGRGPVVDDDDVGRAARRSSGWRAGCRSTFCTVEL